MHDVYAQRCMHRALRPVHTRELAPAARSRSKAPLSAPTISSEKICCAAKLLLPSFAPSYQTGLIRGSKLQGQSVARVCFRSKLPGVY